MSAESNNTPPADTAVTPAVHDTAAITPTKAEEKQARRERRKAQSQSFLARFKQWKRHRPFMGGLLMVCSGAVILAPAYLSLRIKDLLVVISAISGVSTLMLGLLLIMFGIGAWTRPATAPYLGALGIAAAVVSLPTSNFGGFILGALLGIVGGALTLAWEEGEPKSKRKQARRAKKEAKKQAAAQPVVTEQAASEPEGAVEQPGDQRSPIVRGGGLLSTLLAVAALGFVLSSAQPPAVAQTAQGDLVGRTSVVTASEVSVIGNVQAAVVEVPTQMGPKKMIRLSGNEITVDNIALELPGTQGGVGYLTTAPGTIAKLYGSPAVLLTRTLTATPTIAGAPTIPITVDAEGNIDFVTEQLLALGFPPVDLPDPLMQHVSLRNVHLDAYGVFGDSLDAPGLTVAASAQEPSAPGRFGSSMPGIGAGERGSSDGSSGSSGSSPLDLLPDVSEVIPPLPGAQPPAEDPAPLVPLPLSPEQLVPLPMLPGGREAGNG
ncbi:DUF6114 domain-containing protein [Corynebacterium pelargi]|uniref:Uncharacterized protein n=1 Tax=Corynebacterium pelargi TaxID=1471400 RepID=A0A410W7Q3_9CORY|nr:DUF6114 domain-containing protein [Corynebacterium pelargi]QAU51971.1 hypothetical protein CPELA_03460 [Corynebacterium pelargi]GGG71074.1 hypothetical protein GCM10007338_05070 [Corynebacterium pelargi]